MSIEIGTPAKSIRYLNIHKEFQQEGDTCDTDNRFSNPVLDKMDDYITCISRFEVPMNRVPVTQEMNSCIQIYRYNDTELTLMDGIDDKLDGRGHLDRANLEIGAKLVNEAFLTTEDGVSYLEACEDTALFQMTEGGADPNFTHSIDMPPCFTIYQFMRLLNAQVAEALVMNTGTKQFVPTTTTDHTIVRSTNANHRNLFCTGAGTIVNEEEPISRFEVTMSADYTFSVEMNNAFARYHYIKMSPALFNMLQFSEAHSPEFKRIDLPGRRFMGDRTIDITSLRDLQVKSTPGYSLNSRQIAGESTVYKPPGGYQAVELIATATNDLKSIYEIVVQEYITSFTAPVSASDSINRIKSLVFSSSLPTTSEASSGDTYRRILTDYTIPVQSTFSWDPATLHAGMVSENAASEYSYINVNPSAGRWLMLNSPSPLYELKLDVAAKCWDFEKESFYYEKIPLPAGATFTCKLVFISKNDIYSRDKPDQLKG